MQHGDCHPLAIRQTVSIIRLGASGQPFCEGRAYIDALTDRPHHYRVRFRGERIIQTRFVHPDWQQDPARSLRLLTEFWHANSLPSFDDFFPPGSI